MSDRATEKAQRRKELRATRQALTSTEQQEAAINLSQTINHLPNWLPAQVIALYAPADGEIGTTPLEQLARSADKQIVLPVISLGNTLEFALWETNAPLRRNRYHIPEPDAAARRYAIDDIDIIFLPMVGWDRRGVRLGMGGGFYDRALQEVRAMQENGPLLVGLAHACQELNEIPEEPFDVVLDYIATDAGLITCQEHR